jgi:valyl-tRNA synthetase
MTNSKIQQLQNYIFTESEEKWQKFWQENAIYKYDANEIRRNNFIIDTPPPTVSGQLHIGHVYSYTQTDFIARFNRMNGKNIFYPMGFDDNGLPTERLVEKQKHIRAQTMLRDEFVKICQDVVAKEEEKFYELFNKIGLSVDWNLKYQTISPMSQTISQMSFLDLVDKGEIYRDNQPVLWDIVDKTALAQADIEDKEQDTIMNEIIFTSNGENLTISTTRPEMLPACVCLFYHPEDKRYKHLKGQYAITPLFGVSVPILEDSLVSQEKGTGLVMCCTFGDATDLLWFKTHKLPMKIIINKDGILSNILFDDNSVDLDKAYKFSKEIAGLKIKDARNKIIELLKTENLLIKQTNIVNVVKCAERSGSIVEIIAENQWFIHTIKHKKSLKEKSAQINWYPSYMKIRLDNWIDAIAWDWCISRQRYFGVPFPVWYSKREGEIGKALFADIDQLPIDPLRDLPKGYSRDEVEADLDVMDTWATSSISPQLNTYFISDKYNKSCSNNLFPMDLRPQAHEIIRTWCFYTLLKSHLHQNKLPWYNIMISGWCLAHDRSKMSKSKNNVIVPENLLKQYGSDVLRYWASNSKLGSDTAYSEDVMKNGKRLVNKIWNASKFISIHFHKLNDEDKNISIESIENKVSHHLDRWLIYKFSELLKNFKAEMQIYEYANAMNLLEKFFWNIFCDNYLEIAKVRTYNENSKSYSAILTSYHIMHNLLHLFAPFLPHITEEIYQIMYLNETKISIHARANNFDNDYSIFESANNGECEKLIEILDLIRKSKAEKNLSIKAPIKILEILSSKLNEDLYEDLKNVTSSNQLYFVDKFINNYTNIDNTNLKLNILYE